MTVLTEALPVAPDSLNPLYRRGPDGNRIADSVLDGARSVMEAFHDHRTALHELGEALKDDPSMTPAARAKLRVQALNSRKKLAELVEAWMQTATKVHAALDAETSAPPPPRDPSALADRSDLRSALRGLRGKERDDFFDNLDEEDFAAVLRGSHRASGVSKNECDLVRMRYRQKHHPLAAEQLTAWQSAIDRVKSCDKLYAEQTDKLVGDPTAFRVERARDRVAAAALKTSGKEEVA